MEIYYFGTNGEKIGPITKEGLMNLAKAGVISGETRFLVGGKKYKGKQIKNLRPIFEQLNAAAPPSPAPEPETPPEAPTVITPPTPSPGELPPPIGDGTFEKSQDDDVYGTVSEISGPSEAARLSYLHRDSRTQEDSFDSEPLDGSPGSKTFFGRLKGKFANRQKAKGEKEGFHQNKEISLIPSKDNVFKNFWRCYKLCTMILHIAFIIAVVIYATELTKAARLKYVGRKGYKSLTTALKPLVQAYTYKEFAEEVDKLTDVHPFANIQKDIDAWFGKESFEEQTDKMFTQSDGEKIESFEKMVAYLKKATEVTYEDEIEKIEAGVTEQRDSVIELRSKLEDLKEQRRELDNPKTEENDEEEDEPYTSRSSKSTTPSRDSSTEKRRDFLQEQKDSLDADISALETRLQDEEDKLRKLEERLRSLKSASTLGDKGGVIDELDPPKARTRYTASDEIVVTPKDLDELFEYVHSYMSLWSGLFEKIREDGHAAFKHSKAFLILFASGYLAILFLCYFIATRVLTGEEVQKTRFLLEENFRKEKAAEPQEE